MVGEKGGGERAKRKCHRDLLVDISAKRVSQCLGAKAANFRNSAYQDEHQSRGNDLDLGSVLQ